MRDADNWCPTKFEFVRGRLRASRDPRKVSISARLIVDRTAEFYQSRLKAHAGGHLLDLGCGKVPLYGAYRPLVERVTCVDWGHSIQGNQHVDAEVDLTGPLPFEASSFDTIILSDVLEHLPNPDNLWREMARVLRPGGKLILNVPFMYWIHEAPFDYHRYTEYALRRAAEAAGLNVVELEALGGSPEVVADIIAQNMSRLPYVGSSCAAAVQGLASILTSWGPGRLVSDWTRAGFPLSYGLVVQRSV